jgi:exosortase/archaeosortase family protein
MFLACAVAAVLVTRVPRLDQVILVASAIPIAPAANVARIVTTGLLHVMFGNWVAGAVYHDLAGWIMMPMAIACLYLESRLLSSLWLRPAEAPLPPSATEDVAEAMVAAPRLRDRFAHAGFLVLAIGIVAATTVMHGMRTDRWSGPRDFRPLIARLDQIPMTIGDWEGRPEEIDSRAILAAEIEGYSLRHYENSRTGRSVSVLVVCGRPGPISVHTPDLCYASVGYQMAQAKPARCAFPADSQRAPAELLTAEFEKKLTFPPERLRIYWSWNATGTWRVPERPRLTFAPERFLYKLYVIHRTAEGLEPAEEVLFTDFLEQLLPEVEKALFERGTAPDRHLARPPGDATPEIASVPG